MFYNMLDKKLQSDIDYNERSLPEIYGREAFKANEFYNELADWEIAWVKIKKEFSDVGREDELEVAKILIQKYQNRIK